MKEVLLQYARYNVWANERLVKMLQKLSDEQLEKDMGNSFSSIKDTVYHLWMAEYIWQQRLELVERAVWNAEDAKDFEDACNKLQECSTNLKEFVARQYDDNAFTHVLQYYNLKKQSQKLEVRVALMQVFNHASFHRGQVVTMLRQQGVKKLLPLDFMVFSK